jgi:hypothetical protein
VSASGFTLGVETENGPTPAAVLVSIPVLPSTSTTLAVVPRVLGQLVVICTANIPSVPTSAVSVGDSGRSPPAPGALSVSVSVLLLNIVLPVASGAI